MFRPQKQADLPGYGLILWLRYFQPDYEETFCRIQSSNKSVGAHNHTLIPTEELLTALYLFSKEILTPILNTELPITTEAL